jgi:hypothetical protein
MADPTAWTTADAGRSGQAAYPLVDRAPRRHRGQADIAATLAGPVFGPDVS